MENKRNLKALLSLFICGVIITFLIVFVVTKRYERKLEKKDSQIEALTDTVKIWRDAEGLSNSKISDLKSENTKLFTSLLLRNKDIERLQQLAEKYKKDLAKGGRVSYISSETQFDTVYVPKNVPKEYVFTDQISNKWLDFKYVKDSVKTNLKLTVYNDTDIIFGKESKGFLFKTYTPTMQVVQHNPHTKSSNIRTVDFEKTFKQKRFGIGPSAGYGLNQEMESTIFVGFTANYNLIYLF